MRDKLRTEDYYNRQIIDIKDGINQVNNWIETGKTPNNRINFMKRVIVQYYISSIQCKYCIGLKPVELTSDLLSAINTSIESWDGFWKLKDRKGKEYNQYILSAYDEMLWMLSLGYLLNVPDENFQKLVAVIDRDKVKDFLFEFIIRTKLKDRIPISGESYEKYFGVPKVFEKLRQALNETDKVRAEQLVKEFITKDWYRNHKGTGWHNSHKSPHGAYFGYWSFETAAVVKIMDLDDSSFIDSRYYPKDLIH